MTAIELISLTSLPRELTAVTGQPSPSYRKLWTLTVDGKLPTTSVNNRHFVRRDDLRDIAEIIGLPARA